MSFFKRTISFCLCLLLLLSCAAAGLAVSADSYNWAGAWGTPTVKSGVTIGSKLGNGIQLRDFIPANSTVRTVITTTLGGIKIRLKFSNLHGTEAITIDETTIAKTAADKEKVLTDTITPVTFNNGEKAVTIAAGSEVYSDEIDFVCSNMEKLSISTYFRRMTRIYVNGLFGGESYLASSLGNRTHQESVSALATVLKLTSGTITYYTTPYLTRLDVYSPNAYSVVIIGDSTITNNAYLLLKQKMLNNGITNAGVVMSGIIGNRLLYDGVGLLGCFYGPALVDRFDRDALNIPGCQYIILKIGLNDILHPASKSMKGVAPYASVQDILNGYVQLSTRAHNAGKHIYICTRTPYKGYTRHFLGSEDLVWTQECHDMLMQINSWIRTDCTNYNFDGYVDLSPMTDPNDTTQMMKHLTLDGAHLSQKGQIAFVDLLPPASYGASGSLTSLASSLGVDPYADYVAPTQAQSATKKANSGGTKKSSSGSGSSGANTNSGALPTRAVIGDAAPTTAASGSGSTAASPTLPNIQPAGSTQAVAQPVVNEGVNDAGIVVVGQSPTAPMAANITTEKGSGKTGRIIGFTALALVAIGVIVFSAVMLAKQGKFGPALTRGAGGETVIRRRNKGGGV